MNAPAFEYLNLAFKQRSTISSGRAEGQGEKTKLVLLDNIILKKSFNFIFKRFNFSYIYILKVIFFNTSLAGIGLYFWWHGINFFWDWLRAKVWLAIILGITPLQLIFFTYSFVIVEGLPASFVSGLKMTWERVANFIKKIAGNICGLFCHFNSMVN